MYKTADRTQGVGAYKRILLVLTVTFLLAGGWLANRWQPSEAEEPSRGMPTTTSLSAEQQKTTSEILTTSGSVEYSAVSSAETQVSVSDAANFKLLGVIVSADAQRSKAIIAVRSEFGNTYTVGQTIADGIVLYAVENDHVIVRHPDGESKRLYLRLVSGRDEQPTRAAPEKDISQAEREKELFKALGDQLRSGELVR